jgi:hypothetical protein
VLLPTVLPGYSAIAGLGLFATSEIPCGTVVWAPCDRCPRWSRSTIEGLPDPVGSWLDEEGYWLDDDRLLLVCGYGHLMNHSCEPAVLDHGLDFGLAVRDIAIGEEVTCDYRTFVSDPPWLMECRCGTASCARRIDHRRSLSPELQVSWSAQVERSLLRLREVPQPLHNALVRSSRSYAGSRDGAITRPADSRGAP